MRSDSRRLFCIMRKLSVYRLGDSQQGFSADVGKLVSATFREVKSSGAVHHQEVLRESEENCCQPTGSLRPDGNQKANNGTIQARPGSLYCLNLSVRRLHNTRRACSQGFHLQSTKPRVEQADITSYTPSVTLSMFPVCRKMLGVVYLGNHE